MPRYSLDTSLGEGACNALQDAIPFAASLHARPSGCPCLLQIVAAPGYSQHMCCAEPRLSLVQEAYAGGLRHNHLRCMQWLPDISGLVGSIVEVAIRALTGSPSAFCLEARHAGAPYRLPGARLACRWIPNCSLTQLCSKVIMPPYCSSKQQASTGVWY